MITIELANERAGFGIPRISGGPCVVQPQEALACDFHDLQYIEALQFRRRAVNFLRAFVNAPCGVRETPAALIPCTMKKKCHPSSDSVRSTANPAVVVRSFQGPYCFDAKWTDGGKRTAELIRTVPARMSSVLPMTSSTGIANLSTLAPGVSGPRLCQANPKLLYVS